MKLIVALCVHHFHVTHADSDKHESGPSATNPLPPRVKKQSVGVQQTEHDVMVWLNLAGGENHKRIREPNAVRTNYHGSE